MSDVLISGMIIFAFSGCGTASSDPPLVPAAGVLKSREAPVAGATILFAPERGPLAHAVTDADGRFEFFTEGRSGVIAGKGRIAISEASPAMGNTNLLAAVPGMSDSDPIAYADSAAKVQAGFGQRRQPPAKSSAVPKKLQRLETSDLSLQVPSRGSRQLSIEVGP